MDIHSHIHITRFIQVLGDTTVEFVKSMEWPPNFFDLVPSDYRSWMDLTT
jgi:hypothetical protein